MVVETRWVFRGPGSARVGLRRGAKEWFWIGKERGTVEVWVKGMER